METKNRKSGLNRALFDQILFDGSLKILITSAFKQKSNLLTKEKRTKLISKKD